MSGSSAEGVVDTTGAVWGRTALFVADGSVLPTSTGINPMIAIEALAFSISKHVASYVMESQGSQFGQRSRL